MSSQTARAAGGIIARAVLERARGCAFGVLVRDVPEYEFDALIAALGQAEVAIRLAMPGLSETQTELVQNAATQAGFPAGRFVTTIEAVERWRNDPAVAETIVVIAPREIPKLSSLNRFQTVSGVDLSRLVCREGETKLSPNEAQRQLWRAFKSRALASIIPLEGLLGYYAELAKCGEAELAVRSRELLPYLGLLPDPELFKSPTAARIGQRLIDNSRGVDQLRILSRTDRQRISKALASRRDEDAATLQAIYKKVMAFYREQDPALLSELTLSEVQKLFRSSANAPVNGSSSGEEGGSGRDDERPDTNPSVRAIDLLIEGDQETLTRLGETVHDVLEADSSEDTPEAIDPESGVRLDIHQAHPFQNLIVRYVGPDHWGGMIVSAGRTLDEALALLDKADFRAFDPNSPEWSLRAILLEAVGWIGGDADLVSAYDEMCAHRRVLAEHVRALLAEPLVVLNASLERFAHAEAYLDGYRRLVEGLKRRYEAIAEAAPEGVEILCSRVMALDTIILRTAGGFKAVLSPLHPLHLWKYVELSRQVRAQADTITLRERTLLRGRASDLPNFVTTLYLSNYITESGPRVLPEAGQKGGLPFYEELAHQYAGRDGLADLIRVAEKFCILHPHARLGLRIAFIDPPEVDFLLKELVRFADRQGDDLTALHVRIFFTEHGHPRVAALGGGSEDEEGAERFRGAGSSDRFTLEVAEAAMPAARIAESLAQHPAHIAAYFDPSTAKAYRFPRAPSLTVHPLCLPMQFSFDRITKAVRVVPAADGGIFSEHNDLRNRLSNIVTGSFYGVSAELQTESRILQQLAGGCIWLVIADRAQEGALAFDVPRVALHRCGKRDLAIYARGLSRFVSEMDGQLRRCNYTPTRVAVERLIADLNLLLGDGLLSLIAGAIAGAAVDERRTRGLLGTLVASSWFRREHARSLVISIDSPEARRWLELRDSGTRADLFGIVDEPDGGFTVDLVEVKTYEHPEDAFRLSGSEISGPAIDQLLQTASITREIFTPNNEKQRVVSPQRREILRQHLFRECFFETRSDEDKQYWSSRLNELFALEARVRIRLTLVVVGLTQVHDMRQRTFTAQGQPVRLIELAEDEVRAYVGEPVAPRRSGNGPARRNGFDAVGGDGGTLDAEGNARVLPTKDKRREPFDRRAPAVPPASDEPDSEERELIARQAAGLRRILRDHGVQVQELDAERAQLGPSVIRYRVRLRSGAKVSTLRSRAEDIGRELASRTTPFIDNIASENYVGIDLERPKRRTLPLGLAVEALPDVTGLQLPVAVGVAPDGSQVSLDLVQLPHLLVAGSTLSGKTVFLHAVLLSLIAKLPPERLELMIVDPKATDFVLYNGLPYLRSGQVITEAEDAIDHLRQLTDGEMRERTATLQRARLPNISEYNVAHPNAPLRPIVVVIDEYADLIAVLSKKGRAEFEREINRLAQRARSVGIHLVLATQRPTADIVTGLLKANMPCRVSFRLPQRVDSQTILDQSGAENLFGRGDMLLMLNDRLMRLQGYFMPPQEMTRFLGERFPGSGYVPLPDLEESLELEVDDSHRANHESLVGEVTGLAAGPDSGDLLDSDVMILEVEARPGSDTEVIGRAGEVLKQSVLAAWRHVQQHAVEYGVDDSRIRDTGVSVHLVNIARHREGPSAGVPFVVAMVSALSGRAVRPRMAMTGEVSLKGHVGKVGGIPQKIVAAYRNGRTNVILPRTNAADVALVPQEIRDAMQVHLVDNVAEAIAIALEPSSHDPRATP